MFLAYFCIVVKLCLHYDYDDSFQGMIAIKPSGLKSWEGSITFAVCTVGFVLGLPIATEVRCVVYLSLLLFMFIVLLSLSFFARPGGSVCCLFPRLYHAWTQICVFLIVVVVHVFIFHRCH